MSRIGYIGIDSSITSPAICMDNGKKIYFVAFSKRKKHINFIYNNKNVSIKLHEYYKINDSIKERFDRYQYLLERIIEPITIFKSSCDEVKLGIENYSFGSVGAGVTKLAEFGGILRHYLWLKNIDILEIPPPTIKKYFTGTGKASKHMMCQVAEKCLGLNLYKILDLKESKNLDPPHPLEDIADSLGIVYFIMKKKPQYINFVDTILNKLNTMEKL